jgi:hypothetical protein
LDRGRLIGGEDKGLAHEQIERVAFDRDDIELPDALKEYAFRENPTRMLGNHMMEKDS